jgi:hypothetical protein
VSSDGQAPSKVVIRLRSAAPSRLALEAAVDAARALERRLSGVFIESRELISLAALSCAREVSFAGRHGAALSRERIESDLKLAAASAQRELRALARLAGVDLDFEVVQGDLADALDGPVEPGALLALGEPLSAAEAGRLSHLLNETDEIAGVLITGPRAHRTRGPIVVAVEEAHRVLPLLGYAERLGHNRKQGLVLLLVGDTRERIDALRAAVERQLLPALPVTFAQALISRAAAGRGSAGVLAEAVIRFQTGFAIVQLGRLIRARERELQMLAQTLECPMLLLK